MTTDKAIAEALRQIADIYESIGYNDSARIERQGADFLDPPKPKWADGTIAWVTDKFGQQYLLCWDAASSMWRTGGTGGAAILHIDQVTKVEPLRILADDEVAINVGQDAYHWRDHAVHAGVACPTAQDICTEIAHAIEERGAENQQGEENE